MIVLTQAIIKFTGLVCGKKEPTRVEGECLDLELANSL